MFIWLIIFLHNGSLVSHDLSKVSVEYKNIDGLMKKSIPSGFWNQVYIDKLFFYNSIHSVIEVGSWYGASTIYMAKKLLPHEELYAIDIWPSDDFYKQFLSNVIHEKVEHIIKPLRMPSKNGAELLKKLHGKVDLIFIDASHDTKYVYDDLEAWFPYIKGRKGILCGDDWLIRSVKIAVLVFAKRNQLTVYADNNFWFIKENNKYECCSFLDKEEDVWRIL